jgi:RNA polymerase sigma factor (sigma-70 family)
MDFIRDGGLESVSDNVLMEKVKSGDVDKLGMLYDRHKKMLFGYFYRQTCVPETSEDLVQNVFYRILRYRQQFRNEGKFSSWMYSIAHHVFLDHLKNQKKRKEYSIHGLKSDTKEPSYDDDHSEQFERRELLEKAMGQLSDEQREALILSRFHDLKYKEIAEIVNCTEGTVKVRIFRALDQLRKIHARMEK